MVDLNLAKPEVCNNFYVILQIIEVLFDDCEQYYAFIMFLILGSKIVKNITQKKISSCVIIKIVKHIKEKTTHLLKSLSFDFIA